MANKSAAIEPIQRIMARVCACLHHVCESACVCKLSSMENRLRIFRFSPHWWSPIVLMFTEHTVQWECGWEEPRNSSGLTPSHSGFSSTSDAIVRPPCTTQGHT